MGDSPIDNRNCGKYAAGRNLVGPNLAGHGELGSLALAGSALASSAPAHICAGYSAGHSAGHGAGYTAPGWERDESGALRRVKKSHMGRRLPGFDYSQRMIYEITIVLKERRPVLGRLVKKPGDGAVRPGDVAAEEVWLVEPSPLGQDVLDCWRKIADYWPQEIGRAHV